MRRLRLAPAFAAGFVLAAPAHAAELVTPPTMYPPDTWQGKAQAVVRVLDKLDAHTETLTIEAGKSGTYKSLTITAQNCLVHPPGLSPDAAASIGVQDRHPDTKPFSGWMFAAEPYVDIFESPVYGVRLVACSGGDVAPAAPPLVAAAPPAPAAGTAGSATDAGQPGLPTIQAEPAPPPVGAPGGVDQTPDPVYPTGQPDPSAPAAPSAPQN
ncbi:DUF2155 domain-containing protein [Lichenicoccus roseus]|uniref:DUF2155 domain-containing protein n=1 Tax=Lichenicoccus roseus TaxID=2683649 RepID=A0A5R9J6A2_9PROT|nr:DUF2155 domain-containing protein [Lichenicoccus roseus]TLU73144.1 DUF2155 domain-containing protein [Lichenicoccus roseus]